MSYSQISATRLRGVRAWLPVVAGMGVILAPRLVCAQGNAPDSTLEPAPTLEQTMAAVQSAAPLPDTLFIREYRIVGSKVLPRADVETAVYGFLGPDRTVEDVEGARAALEKAYRAAGYETVSVNVPPQRPTRGIVVLQVTEAPVGRLRVKGSRYFDIEQIKKMAPSLAEGRVPNFNEVQRDLIALNQMPDRQITPTIKPGALPDTFDVDLEVKDKFPLHGSVEINNRYSVNTTPIRLDLSLRYDNLWQLGHTIGFGFQIAPQRPDDALIYSGYYIARTPAVPWLSLLLQATRQNSNVGTLGSSNSIGNGEIVGGRFLFNLPSRPGFFHSASAGLDYKHFKQRVETEDGTLITDDPITYFPISFGYNASWVGESYLTEFGAGLTFSLRSTATQESDEFGERRFGADSNFFHFRGNIAHTHDLPLGFQIFGEFQGQYSPYPLVDTEQYSIGGLNTVRGYLESAALGDSGFAASLELRSPSLLKWMGEGNEWRFFVFIDGGYVSINDPLPEQTAEFSLWSYGFGSTIQLFKYLNGSVVIGIPQITQEPNEAGHPLLTFRVWAEL